MWECKVSVSRAFTLGRDEEQASALWQHSWYDWHEIHLDVSYINKSRLCCCQTNNGWIKGPLTQVYTSKSVCKTRVLHRGFCWGGKNDCADITEDYISQGLEVFMCLFGPTFFPEFQHFFFQRIWTLIYKFWLSRNSQNLNFLPQNSDSDLNQKVIILRKNCDDIELYKWLKKSGYFGFRCIDSKKKSFKWALTI